jgi:hypothetical protein
MRRGLWCCSFVVPLIAAEVVAAQPDTPGLAELLQIAGAYVAGYEQNLALVAEEDYSQQVTLTRRTLHSDILITSDQAVGWVEFRDVASRDGVPVRDRSERLLALFTNPHPDRLTQAQRIVAEGARFNLHPPGVRLNRTINFPLTAARFLRPADQYRSSFRIAGQHPKRGVVTVEFAERHRPRLIGTGDQAAANGRFEIDIATGHLQSSTLMLETGGTLATIVVRFGADANVGMWVPLAMNEEYRGRFNGLVTGVATYSRYRQFRVETSEDIRQ